MPRKKKQESDQTPDESGITYEEEDQSEEGEESKESQTSASPQDGQDSNQQVDEEIEETTIQPVEDATDFTHPLLKGKSPEEIEKIVALQEESLKQQGRELNEYHSRLQAKTQESAPPPQQEEPDYGDDFLAPRFKVLEGRLSKRLEEMVAPLTQQVQRQTSGGGREALKQRFKHFATLEPHIDTLLREQGQDPLTASEQQLSLLYHTALGLASERGINLNTQESAPAPQKQEAQVGIPQHRPSSAPMPKPPQAKPRELSEVERRLAKEYFPDADDPAAEYRKFQAMEEDDVVEPGFSKEGW